MRNIIETKYVYLDHNLEIVDANREFYVYFERNSRDLRTLKDFASPAQLKSITSYITSKKRTSFKIFKFLKHQKVPMPHIVMAYNSSFQGKDTVCLRLVEISETMQFIKSYKIEDIELVNALSLTSDCVFTYFQSSNIIKITQFYRGKREILFEQDLDEWADYCKNRELVPANQHEVFAKYVDDLKTCSREINTTIVCGIRTANPHVLEQLSFTSVRFVDSEEIMIVGRILPEDDEKRGEHAKNILEELQIDPLTKVYNKKTITAFAEKVFNENRDDKIALCIIDLDHFKPVNDAYGHLAGDKVLAVTGEILREAVGDRGFVGRYGGDEFLLVIYGMQSEVVLRGFLHTFMIKIEKAFERQFDDIHLTCSVGCAVYPQNGTTYDELFKKADFGLYRAKDKGRNRYVFFRDDLHGELYKKAIDARAGIKYDDREIQELKHMAEFIHDLASKPEDAIQEILTHMIQTYNLDNITFYEGPEMKKKRFFGKDLPTDNAMYALSDTFKKMLAGQSHFRVDFIENVQSDFAEFQTEMINRGIKSTVQCVLGTKDSITGLVTFNRTKESSLWAEYEVNCAAMFASVINLYNEAKKDK